MSLNRISHFITYSVFRIDTKERHEKIPCGLEERARLVLTPANIYLEEEPRSLDWLKELAPSVHGAIKYGKGLFPCAAWIPRYNWTWLLHDLNAGVTIGIVMVPQAMGYASIAGLEPAYGLYTSFSGAVLYWVFGTSRNIVVGPTAISSLLVGQVISRVSHMAGNDYSAPETAHTLSLMCGVVLLFFGLFRLGWIIEFIPYIPISAFVTGASITIISGQIPKLLGIDLDKIRELREPNKRLGQGRLPELLKFLKSLKLDKPQEVIEFFKTLKVDSPPEFLRFVETLKVDKPHEVGKPRVPPYKVYMETFKALHETRIDAAVGLTSLVLLYAISGICSYLQTHDRKRKRTWEYVSSLRLTLVMLLSTVVSYLVNRNRDPGKEVFHIVGKIQSGFKKASIPKPELHLLALVMPQVPAVALILIIDHVSIVKAMARRFHYKVKPSQEFVALGAINLLSPFIGGYPCTGSFGSSAILAESGVRTPLAGLFSAGVLALVLYSLTRVFYYIPKAALAGLIIHAVTNLITPPKVLYRYWQLSPLELCIWVIGVTVAVFHSLEACIYAGSSLSIALLLFRLARTKGQFLGRVDTRRVTQEEEFHGLHKEVDAGIPQKATPTRESFAPLTHADASNPNIEVETPYPGVFIYRFCEGYNYINQAHHIHTLLKHIMANTRRMSEEHYEKESDRLWNDPGPKKHMGDWNILPYLRAVVLDFSSVDHLDITCIQGLIDHFANIHNRWTRRALATTGFGYPTSENPEALGHWTPMYSIAKTLEEKDLSFEDDGRRIRDIEATAGHREIPCSLDSSDVETKSTPPTQFLSPSSSSPSSSSRGASSPISSIPESTETSDITPSETPYPSKPSQTWAAMYGVDRPFFHMDLIDAVDSAVLDAQNKDDTLWVTSDEDSCFTRDINRTDHQNGIPRPQSDGTVAEKPLTQDQSTAPKQIETHYPTGANLWLVFGGLFFAVLCVGLDRSIVATAIPKITSDFNSLDDVGWYGSAYLLTTCCFQLMFGKLYTEYSIKWVFLTGLFIFEVGSVVCATAPNSIALIIGRAVAGVGGAGLVSGALIILARSVPLEKRPKWSGAIGGGVGIAQIIAPTLGGVFTDKATWRWCFWINLPLGGITFFAILFLVKLPADPNKKSGNFRDFMHKFDLVGSIILMPWVICLLLAMQWGGSKYAWSSWRIILLLVLFAVLLLVWVGIQIHEGDRATVPGRIIRQRTMACGLWFMFCTFSNFFIIVYYIPIWFQTVRNESAYQSGINFLTTSAAMSITTICSGIFTGRIGYFVPGMLLSTVLSSVAAGMIYTFDSNTSDGFWIGMLILIGIGIGAGAQQPLIASQTVFHDADISLSTSVLIFTQTLAGTVFISVAENIFQSQLIKQLHHIVPNVDPDVVLNTGASHLHEAMMKAYPADFDGIIKAYNNSLQQVFLISVILSCLTVFGSAGSKWINIKKARVVKKSDTAPVQGVGE
ncbi:hypothetical protein G7046_g3799 [Stylonectria norvegica]|nr:hypothetical protein G7046_g3799 [Stylonectria norvegica]